MQNEIDMCVKLCLKCNGHNHHKRQVANHALTFNEGVLLKSQAAVKGRLAITILHLSVQIHPSYKAVRFRTVFIINIKIQSVITYKIEQL